MTVTTTTKEASPKYASKGTTKLSPEGPPTLRTIPSHHDNAAQLFSSINITESHESQLKRCSYILILKELRDLAVSKVYKVLATFPSRTYTFRMWQSAKAFGKVILI